MHADDILKKLIEQQEIINKREEEVKKKEMEIKS